MGQKASRQLKHPITAPHTEQGQSPDGSIRFGSYGIQGYRFDMEDREIGEFHLLSSNENTGFFAVLDGHGGTDASFFAMKHLGEQLRASLRELPPDFESRDDFNDLVQRAIVEAFLATDDLFREALFQTVENGAEEVQDAGTTAVGVLVLEKHLVFANLGDSRAIFMRDGEVVFETKDHKPTLSEEKARVKAAGGFVAHGRVCSSLAVSRALGDFVFKQEDGLPPTQQMVIAEPEITVFERAPEDEFVLLACDGVWDVLTPHTSASLVADTLLKEDNLANVAGTIVRDALHRNSSDNITAMVVALPGAHKLDDMPDLIDEMFEGLTDSPIPTRKDLPPQQDQEKVSTSTNATSAAKSSSSTSLTTSSPPSKAPEHQPQPITASAVKAQTENDAEPTESELADLERKMKTLRKGRRGRSRLDQVFKIQGVDDGDDEEV